MARRRFEMPMVKRYLPMYQSPELIEELKRHDRMRLVQEREAKRHRSKSPSDSISTGIKNKDRRIDRSSAGRSVSIQVTLYVYFKNDRTRTSCSGKVEHVYSKNIMLQFITLVIFHS